MKSLGEGTGLLLEVHAVRLRFPSRWPAYKRRAICYSFAERNASVRGIGCSRGLFLYFSLCVCRLRLQGVRGARPEASADGAGQGAARARTGKVIFAVRRLRRRGDPASYNGCAAGMDCFRASRRRFDRVTLLADYSYLEREDILQALRYSEAAKEPTGQRP